MVVLEAAGIGLSIAALVLLIYAIAKKKPSLFEASPPNPLQALIEAFSPAPPAPDLQFPASLVDAIQELIAEKHDFCKQYNHSCDVCPRKDLHTPSMCVYDARILLALEQMGQDFDTRMGELINQQDVLQQQNTTLIPLLQAWTDKFSDIAYAQRRLIWVVVLSLASLLMSNIDRIVIFVMSLLGA